MSNLFVLGQTVRS